MSIGRATSIMVTVSRQRSSSGPTTGRKPISLAYLLVGAIVLFSLNTFNVPDENLHNNLRAERKLDDHIGRLELDVGNAMLAVAAANENDSKFTTTASLDVNKIDFEDLRSIATPTPSGSPTESYEATTATKATITSATTMPIRDLIHKRSREVKQLILEQFSGSNSPPNPRYHHSQQAKQATTKNISCSQDDAFDGIPIDDGNHRPWVPNLPEGYSREAITKWEKAFNATMQRIRGEPSGGDELRTFAEAEVKKLRKLRHSLFCKRD